MAGELELLPARALANVVGADAAGLAGLGRWPNAIKIVPATRDLTLASGAQAVTGAGFAPRAVDIMAYVNGTQMMSDGWCGSDLVQYARFTGMNTAAGSAFIMYATGGACAAIYTDATLANSQLAAVGAFTADGCTLNWTKAGSPTGTAMLYLRFWP